MQPCRANSAERCPGKLSKPDDAALISADTNAQPDQDASAQTDQLRALLSPCAVFHFSNSRSRLIRSRFPARHSPIASSISTNAMRTAALQKRSRMPAGTAAYKAERAGKYFAPRRRRAPPVAIGPLKWCPFANGHAPIAPALRNQDANAACVIKHSGILERRLERRAGGARPCLRRPA
jgi:hypothetical protein